MKFKKPKIHRGAGGGTLDTLKQAGANRVISDFRRSSGLLNKVETNDPIKS